MNAMTDSAARPPAVVPMSTTCPDVTVAQAVARELVECRLAACVQMVPIRSVYRWEGSVEEAGEYLLVAKTKKHLVEEFTAMIKRYHPYEVPEVAVMPIIGGSEEYLEWVRSETTES